MRASPDDARALLPPLRDRLLEMVAVLLLGITTIGTAWCGYQASRWSHDSSDLARASSDQRVEAARLYGVATQEIGYDNMIIAQYAAAKAQGEAKVVDFYRSTLIRSDFRPVLQRWEQQIAAGETPRPVLEDPSYLAGQLADYQRTVAAADQASAASEEAGKTAESYIATTIMLSAALFLAGVMSSFRFRTAKATLVLAAVLIAAVVAARLSALPVS